MSGEKYPRPKQPENDPGYALSLILIAVLLGLLYAVEASDLEPGPVKPGAGTVLLGVYVLAWGCMFLASYYFSHKSFFLRGLAWVCEHLSYPRSRKMAFFYFALASLLGGAAILTGVGVIK